MDGLVRAESERESHLTLGRKERHYVSAELNVGSEASLGKFVVVIEPSTPLKITHGGLCNLSSHNFCSEIGFRTERRSYRFSRGTDNPDEVVTFAEPER